MTSQPSSDAANEEGKANPSNVTVVPDPNDPDMVIIRTRKRKRKAVPKRKIGPKARVAIIVVAVIVGVLAAAAIAFAIAVNVGNVNLHQVFNGLDNTPEEAVTQDQGQTIEYDGHTYRYNENVISFLVIGRDDESSFAPRPDASCADVAVLFTMDTSNNKAHAIVVPRNSWVPVDLYDENENFVATREMQLTLSHAVLLDTVAECAANTTKSVSYLFYNLPITYYVDIDQEVVADASTAVGGVQLEALESIPGQPYSAGETVILEGNAAFRYVQYRNVDVFESALDRQARQVQFVKAFASKLSGLGAQDIMNLYNSVSDDIVTNLGMPELAYLATCFATGDNADIEISSLSGTTDVVEESDGVEYERYYLDQDSVVKNMLDAFYTKVD